LLVEGGVEKKKMLEQKRVGSRIRRNATRAITHPEGLSPAL
jgi:hypothetical protein